LFNFVSVCVEGTVAIPEPKQSLIPECFDTSGYVRSLFVLDSPINALSDSYHPVDGHVRVWRPRNTTFQQEHIVGTTAFGGGDFTVWGCSSLNCKIDLYVFDGTLTGQRYRDPIPYGHVPIEAWQFCGVLSVADVLLAS
jgi:hypothetical protein